MAFELALRLLCFLTFQGLNGQVCIVPTCTEKVSQLQEELKKKLTKAAGCDVIDDNIAHTRVIIDNALQTLHTKINAAVGPNAEHCRNLLALELLSLNRESLNMCCNTAESNCLNRKIRKLCNLKQISSIICKLCQHDPPCVDAHIISIKQQLQKIIEKVSSEAADVVEKSAKCVRDVETGQMEIIKKALHNFDVCMRYT